MLRRDFIQIGTLGVAGLLAAGTPGQAAPPKLVAIAGYGFGSDPRGAEAVAGAGAMLREGGVPFDVIHRDADFSSYKVLILPDYVRLADSDRVRLEAYLKRGGSVLASFQSGLAPDGSRFATAAFGIDLVGQARFSPDFIDIQGSVLESNIAGSELVMYLRGMEVLPNGATVLARTLVPLPHAPSYPAATEYGKALYFMHPVFTQYHRTVPRWCRHLVLNALERLVPGVAAPVYPEISS